MNTHVRFLASLAAFALAATFSACGDPPTPQTAPEESGEPDTRLYDEAGSARAAELAPAGMGVYSHETRRAGFQTPQVQAASHDDNEEYLSWQEYMAERQDLPLVLPCSYKARVIVRVTDADGRPVMNRAFRIEDDEGAVLWRGRTYANGESVIFPRCFLPRGSDEPERVVVENGPSVPWQPTMEGMIPITLQDERTAVETLPVDVAFVMDATGSMGDEIQQLKDVVFSIHQRLQSASEAASLRFGLVTYRDRTDREPLNVVPFTPEVDSFEIALAKVQASGGGDYPEDLESGLAAALNTLDWRDDGIRAMFVVADAPPHSDYGMDENYLWAGREANRRAVRVHMVGASGLRAEGEYIFRQIAAMSYGQFIFLTYGETGESSGAGTPDDPGKVSHHTGSNFTSRRLDDIVVDAIRRDMAYHVDVPLLASDNPPPEAEDDKLKLRMRNLWGQIVRQVERAGEDSATAVLLPFENALGDSALAAYLGDVSMEVLVAGREIDLVERARLDVVLAEHELAASGLVDVGDAVELGNLLGSRLVLLGKVYRLGTDRVVHVRAVDSESARIVAAARVRV